MAELCTTIATLRVFTKLMGSWEASKCQYMSICVNMCQYVSICVNICDACHNMSQLKLSQVSFCPRSEMVIVACKWQADRSACLAQFWTISSVKAFRPGNSSTFFLERFRISRRCSRWVDHTTSFMHGIPLKGSFIRENHLSLAKACCVPKKSKSYAGNKRRE